MSKIPLCQRWRSTWAHMSIPWQSECLVVVWSRHNRKMASGRGNRATQRPVRKSYAAA